MVNIDRVVEVGVEIDGRAANKIPAAMLHQQRGKALVRSGQPRLQRQQACRGEAGIPYRTGLTATIYPLDYVRKVHAEARFIGAPVELAENATPVPPQ